jgi:hypothetical protein
LGSAKPLPSANWPLPRQVSQALGKLAVYSSVSNVNNGNGSLMKVLKNRI